MNTLLAKTKGSTGANADEVPPVPGAATPAVDSTRLSMIIEIRAGKIT